MSSHYIVPTFNKSTPNKLHKDLAVTGQNTVSHPSADSWISAIATESIPAVVDGEYIFVVRIDNIGHDAGMMIGVTPMETFNSNWNGAPGNNSMTGSALNLFNGNYCPGGDVNLINSNITNKAKEVIVVVTITENGARRLIRWIVNGTSSTNHELSGDCKRDKLFTVVSIYSINTQITTIPIDQITIRNDEVNKLVVKFSKQSSTNQGAVANNNNQQQPSSAAFAQLQQELDKERKRADLAETQLQQEKQQHEKEKQNSAAKDQQEKQHSLAKDQQLQKKDQEIQNERKISSSLTIQVQQKDQELQEERNQADMKLQQQSSEIAQKDQQLQQKDQENSQLKQQLLTLQSQINNNNNSSAPSSPFVKDKLYQIDFGANGIIPPADPNAFGTLLKLPSQNNSVLFQHVKNELWKKLGTSWPSPKGVYDFTLESVEVVYCDVASIELRMRRLQQLRSQNGNFFNPPTGAFTAEQLQTLISLRDHFLPRSSNADPKSPNLINVFHGTKVDRLQSVVNGLVAVRSTDAGYFGSGVYTTTSIEYAAKYAKGEFDCNFGPYPPRASDGCIPVVWCVAAVGVCYPLTREVDYSKKRVHGGMDVSDFFGAPLTPGYDCHCVAVNESVGFQAVPRKDMQYMEVVFDQEVQVLPIAVLWVKSL